MFIQYQCVMHIKYWILNTSWSSFVIVLTVFRKFRSLYVGGEGAIKGYIWKFLRIVDCQENNSAFHHKIGNILFRSSVTPGTFSAIGVIPWIYVGLLFYKEIGLHCHMVRTLYPYSNGYKIAKKWIVYHILSSLTFTFINSNLLSIPGRSTIRSDGLSRKERRGFACRR